MQRVERHHDIECRPERQRPAAHVMPADPNIIKRRGESVLLAYWSLAFSEDERVLDVGCGDGLLTRAAARMLALAYAVRVDASPRMIATAHAATAPTESGPWLVVADAGNHPDPDRRTLDEAPVFRETQPPVQLIRAAVDLKHVENQRLTSSSRPIKNGPNQPAT